MFLSDLSADVICHILSFLHPLERFPLRECLTIKDKTTGERKAKNAVLVMLGVIDEPLEVGCFNDGRFLTELVWTKKFNTDILHSAFLRTCNVGGPVTTLYLEAAFNGYDSRFLYARHGYPQDKVKSLVKFSQQEEDFIVENWSTAAIYRVVMNEVIPKQKIINKLIRDGNTAEIAMGVAIGLLKREEIFNVENIIYAIDTDSVEFLIMTHDEVTDLYWNIEVILRARSENIADDSYMYLRDIDVIV